MWRSAVLRVSVVQNATQPMRKVARNLLGIPHSQVVLWRFHAIHHSQREMNIFSVWRQHVCEHLLPQGTVVRLLISLWLRPQMVVTIGTFFWRHTLNIHADIRTNIFPLGWVFVSTQFHQRTTQLTYQPVT